MASIPLPALHLNPPPQQENPVEQYGRILQLKNMMAMQPLQQQAMQQQVQAGQLENQQKQQSLKDQQAATAAMQEWDGKDINQLPTLMIKKGASAQAVMGLKSKALEMQQTYSKIAADDATTGAKNIETRMKKNDMVGGAFSTVLQTPDAELPQAIISKAQELAQQGLLDPQHVQMAQQIAQQPPAQARQALDTMRKGMLADSQLLEQAKTKAQMQNEQMQRQQEAQRLQQQGQYQQQEIGIRKAQLGIEGARLNFEKAKQGTQDQQAIETMAQQIANGDVKAPSLSRNNPFNRAVLARVYEINPKYSDSLYTMTQALRSDKPNSMGGNVGRLGTAILHADNALGNSANLGFSEGLLTGVPTAGTSAYKQDAEFLTGEVGQYVTGGKLTVDEGKKLSSDLMSSRQSVRDSAIHEIISLSKGKLESQKNQWKNATQTDFPTDRVFNDPAIVNALQKHGILGGSAQPNGSVVKYKIVNGQLVPE
jgi:hypothetical protein